MNGDLLLKRLFDLERAGGLLTNPENLDVEGLRPLAEKANDQRVLELLNAVAKVKAAGEELKAVMEKVKP